MGGCRYLHNGRLVSLLLISISLIACQLCLASSADAASYSEDITEDISISDSLSVAVYRLNGVDVSDNLSLSESVLANKFSPSYETIPISDSLSVVIYSFNIGDVAETIAIGDGVQVHRYSPLAEGVTLSESVLVNKFSPGSETLTISESVSVAVHRLNRGMYWGGTPGHLLSRDILDDFRLSEAVLVEKLPPGWENIPISDSVSVAIYRASPPAKPINWWLIGGIIAAVVIAGFVIFLVRRMSY